MAFQKAVETYTVLTIGDGLVTVIPALMISISGGLIITRTTSDVHLGVEFERQVFNKSEPLLLASGVFQFITLFMGDFVAVFLLGGAIALAWICARTWLILRA